MHRYQYHRRRVRSDYRHCGRWHHYGADRLRCASQYNSYEIDGTVIQQGDTKLTLSKLDTRPTVGDTVTMDGKTYRIMDVYPVRMSGADVVYVVQGRV